MATLQIRDLPNPFYQLLQLRARQHHMSMSQHVLSEPMQASEGDPHQRRRQALAELEAMAQDQVVCVFHPSPEALILQDRSRGGGARE